MSIHRTRRISARAAENLLSGAGVDGLDGRCERLAVVLRAAAGPTRPGELGGRHQARAAFRGARRHPVPSPRRPSMIKTAVLKLLTVKAAAVAALVVGTGGVALAASTGALPNPLNTHATPRSTASHPGSAASAHPGGQANPSPSLVGLCHAYTAGAGSEHGKALDSPAFQALLSAAGGKANVAAFCTRLLAGATAPSPNPAATRPSTHPTGEPTDHPTGEPTTHATGQPTQHPTH
jgi:hypothetical protein